MADIFDEKTQTTEYISDEYYEYLIQGGTVLRQIGSEVTIWALTDGILHEVYGLCPEQRQEFDANRNDPYVLTEEALEQLTTEIDLNEFYIETEFDLDA